MPGQKTLVAGRALVGIIGLELVGDYAVRITFDDPHRERAQTQARTLDPRVRGASLMLPC